MLNFEAMVDEELLSLFASTKDEAYFGELHRRYRDDLTKYVERVNPHGNHAEAEDIVQQAFLNVHLNHDSFDPAMKFRPWLFSIAANFTINHKIAVKRRRLVPLNTSIRYNKDQARAGEMAFDPEDYREGQPEEPVLDSEQAVALRALVELLPPKDREVIELHYFQGRTISETAEDLGIPSGSVKTQLNRSLRFLRCRGEATLSADAA